MVTRVEYLAFQRAPVPYCLVTDMSHGGVRINAVGFRSPTNLGCAAPDRIRDSQVLLQTDWRVCGNVGANTDRPSYFANA